MDSNTLPSVEKVKSTVPLTDLQAFDMMSRFLQAEKAKHLSLDIAGQSYLSTSSQIWNDLRLACNSLLEDNDHRREPVAEWKMDADIPASPSPEDETPEDSTTPLLSAKQASPDTTDSEEARRSAKKEKKELKKARKEEKRSAKKAKKDAKKAKKEAKKRKRESLSS